MTKLNTEKDFEASLAKYEYELANPMSLTEEAPTFHQTLFRAKCSLINAKNYLVRKSYGYVFVALTIGVVAYSLLMVA